MKLRKYQEEAIDALYQYWADGRGDNPLIVAPTGAGKSAILAKLVEDANAYKSATVAEAQGEGDEGALVDSLDVKGL